MLLGTPTTATFTPRRQHSSWIAFAACHRGRCLAVTCEHAFVTAKLAMLSRSQHDQDAGTLLRRVRTTLPP